jgi:protein-tyrosine phosphatase
MLSFYVVAIERHGNYHPPLHTICSRMKSILFVCMGNLCRSPIAEAVATEMAARRGLAKHVRFASAGTHPPRKGEPADVRARQVGLTRGYDLSRHRARKVEASDFRRFDWVFAMDDQNLAALAKVCPPEAEPRMQRFLEALGNPELTEVPDPYFGSLGGFERVFDLCEAGLEAIFRQGRRFGIE